MKSCLKHGDAIMSEDVIGCGKAGSGIVNMVGDRTGTARYGYIQISNSGDPDECIDGIRIYGNGTIRHYDSDGDEDWSRSLSMIPTA